MANPHPEFPRHFCSMNTTRLTLILSFLLLTASVCWTPGCRRSQGTSSIVRDVAELRSSDFHALRRAQAAITAEGLRAVPILLQTARSSDSEQQIGLSCYLIGTIDRQAYLKLLSELAVPGLLCAVLRYPNSEAIQSASSEQRLEFEARFGRMASQMSKEEVSCVEKMMEASKRSGK